VLEVLLSITSEEHLAVSPRCHVTEFIGCPRPGNSVVKEETSNFERRATSPMALGVSCIRLWSGMVGKVRTGCHYFIVIVLKNVRTEPEFVLGHPPDPKKELLDVAIFAIMVQIHNCSDQKKSEAKLSLDLSQ
jgi:hypothetical protein